MRYALIGCGRISPNHIAAAKANGLEFVGICDIDPKNMKDKVAKFELGDVPMFEDYHEMLEKQKPELVAVCTESGKHAAIALDCIDAGCNVIIEKPIALSLKDADEIIRLRRALTWAWMAIGALSLTTIGACLVAWEVARH